MVFNFKDDCEDCRELTEDLRACKKSSLTEMLRCKFDLELAEQKKTECYVSMEACERDQSTSAADYKASEGEGSKLSFFIRIRNFKPLFCFLMQMDHFDHDILRSPLKLYINFDKLRILVSRCAGRMQEPIL